MPKKVAARTIPRTTPDAGLVIRALMELSRGHTHARDHIGENTLHDSTSQEPDRESGDQDEPPTPPPPKRTREPTSEMR
jgi:hypothetical protein